MENMEIETNGQTVTIENQTAIESATNKRKRPPEEERLWAVLSHITLGIIGIIVLAGGIKTVAHSRFTKRHALTALFNGIAAVVVSILWYYIYVGVGLIAGEQVIYDVFRIGMLGLIMIFSSRQLLQALAQPREWILRSHGRIRWRGG